MAAALAGDGGARIVGAVLDAVGASVEHSEVRSVHRRGTTTVSVVHRVALTDRAGRAHDRLYVTHASTRDVPSGAATVDVDGTVVHVWQFPDDPYLPGLPSTVNRATAAALLRRHGHDTDRAAIHTRSYRPARRAVVELRPRDDAAPAVYCKLLGGRSAARIERRTTRLAEVHDHLLAAGLPVPRVLEQDSDLGRVALEAVRGATLRTVLRSGGRPPPPAAVRKLVSRLHALAPPDPDADPDAFADTARHVALLRARVPDRAADLDRLAAVTTEVGGPTGTIHGDLHDGQLLVVDGAISGLLDIDGVGTGHVAHDVGRLVAAVEASTVAAPPPHAPAVRAYLAALVDELGTIAPAAAIGAATAAAWVGLATGPVRVASPAWRAEVDDRLDRALSWAARAT